MDLLCAAQGSDQCADAHQRDEQRLDDGLPFLGAVALVLREPVDEVLEQEHARDLTSVIAKEESTDGGNDPQENRLKTTVGAIDADGPEDELADVVGTGRVSVEGLTSFPTSSRGGDMPISRYYPEYAVLRSKQERLDGPATTTPRAAARPL